MSPVVAMDPADDARHPLEHKPDARESLAFVVGIPEAEVAFIAYTWVNDASQAGSALAVFGPGVGGDPIFEVVDGIDVPRDMGFDAWQVGAITVRHGKPLVEASIDFAGEAASVSYTFEGMHEAYNYGQAPGGCPWYLADDRFEQSGWVKGVLRIGDREIPFEQTGHRDHSWGTRNWGAIQHWKWIWAQTPDGTAVHAIETFGLGKREVLGYVHKDGVIAEVVGLEDDAYDLDPRIMHSEYRGVLIDDAGRRTAMTYRGHSNFVFPVSANCTMHEVAMVATIDGVDGIGHVEMGWPRQYLEDAQADAGITAHYAR
ncbi:DUF7064 domain-containing protein [Patulibacter minatonensis]|uniref:DUF7064 domain-containing protein n=1 Tax=Patulibacter minatonensis TaxID=298163 RepID=UPI00047E3941|nr:hypothetical protein [Patulibacter minatonensis]